MKNNSRPWTASFFHTRLTLLLTFLFLSFASIQQTQASGAKLPDVADSSSTGTDTGTGTGSDTSGTLPTTSTGSGSTTAPWPTAGAFNQPWTRSGTSIVLDVYEGNSIDWTKLATDSKVVGIIHRSSIGSKVDAQYANRKQTALSKGYLWGAYHLGYKGNAVAQADLFLSVVQNDPDTLMVLDLENTSDATLMGIDDAILFMNRVYEKTGRIPTVYANQSTVQALNSSVKSNALFQQSKLWYARFKSSVTDVPSGGIWPSYFLWQFSSELNCTSTGSCLYNAPGTQFDMDVNVFNGSRDELAAHWNNN